MSENLEKVSCPECDELDRRDFIRVVGCSAAVLGGLVSVPTVVRADNPAPAQTEKPAEGLIRELYSTLTAEQKANVVLPWDHGGANPTRLGMYNAPIQGKRIGQSYTQAQQELIDRIVHAMCNGEEGYRRISRNNRWDSSGSLQGCGAVIFGEPKDNERFSFVFVSHHLTIRCDGNSEPGAAFGGPMYYGHSPNGYSPNNVWFYQTQSVLSVWDMLNENQRKQAVVVGSPGEHAPSVRFRPQGQPRPGIGASDLTADQKRLVETVMRNILSPYRQEDANEVMDIVRQNGGMDRIHLAFYRDRDAAEQWHFWRLEGPGFVWNYRVLPHVHTYVNISSRIG